MHLPLLSTALLSFLSLPALTTSKLILDYQADRNDPISNLGLRNLEASRGDKAKKNSDDLFIKKGKDNIDGSPAAHFHRKKGNIRTEYHALKKGYKDGPSMVADNMYNITYEFSLGSVGDKLMVWQLKEYEANNNEDGGANIPLALEIQKDSDSDSDPKIEFQYQSSSSSKRESQWSRKIQTDTRYLVNIIIDTSTPGSVQLVWDGEEQELNGQKVLEATTFPGQADPKFGAYRGEEEDIDTFVYLVQVDEMDGSGDEGEDNGDDDYDDDDGGDDDESDCS